jgi:hypothetical protein
VDVRAQANIPQGTLTKIFKASLWWKCVPIYVAWSNELTHNTFLLL